MADNFQSNQGSFSPTTFILDVENIYRTEVNTPEFKELLVRLYQNLFLMATILNTKHSALYPLQEFCNGQAYFPLVGSSQQTNQYRQVFRTTIDFGALPNATSIARPHNIDIRTSFRFTRIYGASSDPLNMAYIPLPYASSNGTDNIQVDVDVTNVTLTTTKNWSSYTTTYLVLEYVKN